MERYKPYEGRRHSVRRRRGSAEGASVYHPERATKRTVKLAICVGLFAAAALFKLLFPSAFALVGEKINSVVNYKAALTALGEGFSGEKKFTAALSEAITYAFTGSGPEETDETAVTDGTGAAAMLESDAEASPAAIQDTAAMNTADTPADSQDEAEDASEETTGAEESVAAFAESQTDNTAVSFSEAVVAAFKESQEEYADYAVPAGVSYEMPALTAAHTAPVDGTLSSAFGFRVHPTKQTVLFHYGTDIAAPKGTEIVAFADGKVIAAGDSETLGKYVILSHGNVATTYGHCSAIHVKSGQTVVMNERIASVGSTGNATENCLHFELKINGQYVNAAYYIGEWQ